MSRAGGRRAQILLFGGTFNPIHLGHLRAARAAKRALRSDRVVLVPCALPPHRSSRGLAAASERLAMARAAVRGLHGFSVADIEVRRRGPSYTVDTVAAFRKAHPRAELIWLLGLDAALLLPTWRGLRSLLREAEIAVVTRPGIRWSRSTRAAWRRSLEAAGEFAHRIRLVPISALPISATSVRARAASGLSLRGLVPPAVARRIAAKRLYCSVSP